MKTNSRERRWTLRYIDYGEKEVSRKEKQSRKQTVIDWLVLISGPLGCVIFSSQYRFHYTIQSHLPGGRCHVYAMLQSIFEPFLIDRANYRLFYDQLMLAPFENPILDAISSS
jgi:hypothetical protein